MSKVNCFMSSETMSAVRSDGLAVLASLYCPAGAG